MLVPFYYSYILFLLNFCAGHFFMVVLLTHFGFCSVYESLLSLNPFFYIISYPDHIFDPFPFSTFLLPQSYI
jgi:hypothetical protein